MPHIIAYSFSGDTHCIDCTVAQYGDDRRNDEDHDNNGISLYARDEQDNYIHPIFDTDELIDGCFCGDCQQFIK